MIDENQYWEKIDLHTAVLEAVLSMLPPWLIRQSVDEKGAHSRGLPVEVFHCESNHDGEYYAAIWHILTGSRLDRYIGYIEVFTNNEVICSSEPLSHPCGLPDSWNSYKPIPFWKKLTLGELELHTAEIEIVRSMLPVWLIQRTEERKGQPVDMLVYNADSKTSGGAGDSKEGIEYYAFIWHVRNGSQLKRFIGNIELSTQKGLIYSSSMPIAADEVPDFLSSCTRVPFGDYFWIGETQKLQKNEEKEQVQIAQSLQRKDQDAPIGEDPVMKAIREIQKDYDPEPKDRAIEESERRWRRHPEALDPSKPEDLDEIQELCLRIGTKVSNFTFPHENFSVTAFRLSFYTDYSLYQITDRRGLRSRTAHVVAKRSSGPDWKSDWKSAPICFLGNTSIPIHQFNKTLLSRGELELVLTKEAAADYLVFFCRFVHGEAGAFPIIEDPSKDLDWIDSKADQESDSESGESKRSKVEGSLRPVQWLRPLDGTSQDSNFYYSAFVCYGRNLFVARFQVEADGMVVMKDDNPCFVDLPIIPIVFDDETEFVLKMSASEKGG